jgi:hypothetical protein
MVTTPECLGTGRERRGDAVADDCGRRQDAHTLERVPAFPSSRGVRRSGEEGDPRPTARDLRVDAAETAGRSDQTILCASARLAPARD